MAANQEVLNYLIAGAKRRGIDPATVTRAFGHEGLNVFDPSKPDLGGDEGSSFGPYQLHYKGMSKSMPNAGMGDDFTAKTGLHARDPSTWRAQTDFVLDYLQNGGNWSPWMGAKAEGITGRMGLNTVPGTMATASASRVPPASQSSVPAPNGAPVAVSPSDAPPPAAKKLAGLGGKAEKGIADIFSLMALQQAQQPEPQAQQVMGPSPEQSQGLLNLLRSLGARQA